MNKYYKRDLEELMEALGDIAKEAEFMSNYVERAMPHEVSIAFVNGSRAEFLEHVRRVMYLLNRVNVMHNDHEDIERFSYEQITYGSYTRILKTNAEDALPTTHD